MADTSDIVANLSPEKKALLLSLLAEDGSQWEEERIEPRPMAQVLPMSSAQQRLWFVDRLSPGSTQYTIPAMLRIRGPLQPDAVQRALAEIWMRHGGLRVNFISSEGRPVQIRNTTLTPEFSFASPCSRCDEGGQDGRIPLAMSFIHRPFDLSHDTLLRALLIRGDDDDHVLVITVHHIVFDGWSTGVFLQEFKGFYARYAIGKTFDPPQCEVEYADYAWWEQQTITGNRLSHHLAFWTEYLAGAPGVLPLPTDSPRPQARSPRGRREHATVGPEITRQLRAIAANADATLTMVLLSAWCVLLHRYCDTEDIVVGMPVANRGCAQTESMLGLFVNTLPVRCRCEPKDPFTVVLGRVRRDLMDVLAHQEAPFEKIVDALHVARDVRCHPLFQVVFDFQTAPLEGFSLPGLEVSLIDPVLDTSKFDLMLTVEDEHDELAYAIEYASDILERTTVHGMLQCYAELLRSIVADHIVSSSTVSILPASLAATQRCECSGGTAEIPMPQTLPALFEQQVARTPQAIAAWANGITLTFCELNERANRLAWRLRRVGVRAEQPVAIMLERSVDWVAAVLGVLKAGGAYVPLDLTYPPDRVAQVLDGSSIRVVIAEAGTESLLPRSSVVLVQVATPPEGLPEDAARNHDPGIVPDSLAYVIYTSGSTGRPKGVMITHRSVANLWFALQRVVLAGYKGRPLRVSVNAPLAFDASVQQLVMLCGGHAAYVIPGSLRHDGPALCGFLKEHRIDVLDCVPSQLALLIDAGLLSEDAWRPLILLPGGEAIGGGMWHTLVSSPGVAAFNMYGPTECTVDPTICPVAQSPDMPSIGRPIVNLHAYVLDKALHPVPPGVPGEVFIGGEGVGRGYAGRPDLTAERFLPDPWAFRPGERMYRTGDQARLHEGGLLEYCGRLDNQVKIRGQRIELEEIDAVLVSHAAVRKAVTIVHEPAPGSQQVVSYVLLRDSASPSIGDIQKHVRAKLPPYMVPNIIIPVDAFPLNPNGKIDRSSLPWPGRVIMEDRAPEAELNPVQRILAGIWEAVLGTGHVGADDNFFALGGHSLNAGRIIARIRETFGVELPLQAIFECQTLADLAGRIEAFSGARIIRSPIPVTRRADQVFPLSFGQQRLWFLDRLEPGSPLYNIAAAVRLTGPLNVLAFRQSLDYLVQRHEVLRTVFPAVDGRPVQAIAPELVLDLPVDDLQDMPIAEREQRALVLASDEVRRPFDLSRGPLLRVRLQRLAVDDHMAVLSLHHIISDGWSMGVLIREIAACYQAFSTEGGPPLLPALPIQYADFSVWQHEWLSAEGGLEQGGALNTQLEYWKQQLSGSSPLLELPTDRTRPPVQSYSGSTYHFALQERLCEGVNTLAQQHGGTLFMVLLAAFQTLLHRYTGQDDICVGTPIANRSRAEVEGLIGFFVNTLVLRTNMAGDPGFRDLLKQVREKALGAYAHQDLPFEQLVDALQPQRDMSHSPLFQVMFVLQNAPTQPIKLPGLTASPVRLDTGVATSDLTLTVAEKEGGLDCALEFNTDLFDATSIVRMAGHFETLLEGIVADPDQRISMLPLLTEAERQHVLARWNDTAANWPNDRCVHHLFEAQAERTPEAIAISMPATEGHSGQRLTYRELNQRANQLAHHLVRWGVKPETLVGLCVERSLDMVTGLLGILKAGGGYLPLDPAYPTERLTFMLRDAAQTAYGIPVVLTQSRLRDVLARSLTGADCRVICLDTDWDAVEQESEATLDTGVSTRNLAYVIYTSGSTGQPKGVAVEHRSVVNHNVAFAKAIDMSTRDKVLQFATINFDSAAEELFPALSSGATVVLRPEGMLVTGAEFSQLIDSEQLTVLDLPTAYWHEWVYELSLLQRPVPESVRMLVLGGEKAEAARMELYRQMSTGDVRWVNTYGPTEGTIIATLYDPEREGGWTGGRELPIGRPIANARVHLLDQHLQPVPIGVPGELYIGGVGVARGYLNRPDLTADKFIPDPFCRDLPSACLYRTGDLARYLPDGNIEFLGRLDQQVKVRGFRVELGEIEAALGTHPAVRQAVVLCLTRDETSGKRLVAYVVPAVDEGRKTESRFVGEVAEHETGSLPVAQLRDFLKVRLPEYMIPSTFVMLNSLPVTPSGKIDRKALPAPEQALAEMDTAHVAPRTPEEETLARIWAQVLGLGKVSDQSTIGIHDNFFELGGDSILSIQVIARANQAGLRLSPRQLFENPTVAGLAAVATVAQPGTAQCEQGIVQGPVPLTPIQQWFFEQDFPEPHHWNQSVLLDVQVPMERTRLETATEQLLAHHDALRLRFTRGEAGWQSLNAGVQRGTSLEWIDLSGLGEADQNRTIEEKATDVQASLSLATGPLMRVEYFDRGAGQPGQLLMVIHHLVVDTMSWRILLEDLMMAYEQQGKGEPIVLPAKTTSFRDWALQLQEYALSEDVRKELNDWLNVSGERIVRLPIDHRNGQANLETSARTETAWLSVEETTALLHQVPSAYGTEINDILLTALAQTFQHWAGDGALLIDLEGHGREDIAGPTDLSRTVGWFTTVFPVCLDLRGVKGPGEAVKATKEQLKQIAHHGIGYGLLRYLCKDNEVRTRLAALPQAEVSFNYLGQLDQSLPAFAPFRPARGSVGPSRSLMGRRSHAIEINGGVIDGQLQLDWTYSENLHRKATVEWLANDFVEVLRSLIAHCLSPEAGGYTPSDFPDAELSKADIEALVREIGGA